MGAAVEARVGTRGAHVEELLIQDAQKRRRQRLRRVQSAAGENDNEVDFRATDILLSHMTFGRT